MKKFWISAMVLLLAGCGAKGGEETTASEATTSTTSPSTTSPSTTTTVAVTTTTIPKGQAIEEMDAEVARACDAAAAGLADPEIRYDRSWSPYRTKSALLAQAQACVKAKWAAVEEAKRKAEAEAREAERIAEEQRRAAEEAALGTVSQQNARQKAADYLDYTAFSRSGLIEQLVYEGFSEGDATFGVDALNVDWNEQAALKAADYLDYSAFSRAGLIEQLLYEGFTQAQAEYGVSTTGL